MKDRKGSNKKGFTLVEMSVVLVLIALVSIMIISFSVLIERYIQKNNGAYNFYEECDELKRILFELVQREDEEGKVCKVEGTSLKGDGYSVTFRGYALVITIDGTESRKEFGEIEKISFVVADTKNAVLCTAVQGGDEEDKNVQTFLITMRCGTFESAAGE